MFPTRRITTMGGDKFRDEFSLAFDGTNDYINCGDSADYHHDNGSASIFSVSIWVKITSSTSNDDTIISKYEYTDDKREWRISLDGSQNIKFVSSQNGTNSYSATTSNALVDNRWYHIVMAYNGSEATATNRPKIFLDGVHQSLTFAGGDHPAQINEDDCALTIGCMLSSGSASGLPPMKVSEATFYNTKLSASQVATLYNGREPYNHKEGVASGSLSAWWRMGDGRFDGGSVNGTEQPDGGIVTNELLPTISSDLFDANHGNFDNTGGALRSGSEINSGALSNDNWYEISAQDGVDFTTYDAPDNNVGTIFYLNSGSPPTMDSNDKVYPVSLHWTHYDNNKMSIDSGALKITYVDNANGAYLYLRDSELLTQDLVVGRIYKITLDVKINTGSAEIRVDEAGTTINVDESFTNTSFETFTYYFMAGHATNVFLRIEGMGSGEIVHVDNVVLQELGDGAGILQNMEPTAFVGDTP